MATAETGVMELEEIAETAVGDSTRASWPWSSDQVNANMAHCSEEGREVMRACFLWSVDAKHPVSRAEFARKVGYSANLIYRIMSGKYVHPETGRQLDVPEKLVEAARKFLDLERERYLGGRNEFVLTPTARRMWLGCDLARESQTPVFVIGPSHIGKTWALEHYTHGNNHGRTVYIRMKAASGLGGMVRRIAERVGVSPNANTADLVERIKNAITPNMLIIIDEVHLLQYTYRLSSFFACMEVLREIYDETQCGMVLCGTELLLPKLREGKNGEMEQMLRRGVHRIILPKQPTWADIRAIAAHWGLQMPGKAEEVALQGVVEKPYEVLRQLAQAQGLKAITERLRYGRKLAVRANRKLSWRDFVEAHLTIASQCGGGEGWE